MIVKCPRCKKEVEWEENKWRPFCSERCKSSDLGAWATEEYKMPEDIDEDIRDSVNDSVTEREH